MHATGSTHGPGRPAHTTLNFGDVDMMFPDPWGLHIAVRLATPEQIREAIEFARGRERLLVHCQAGVSRSTALGLGCLADRMGPGSEERAVHELMRMVRWAVPNLWVVKLADDTLGREGRLLQALLDYERVNLPGNDLRRRGWEAHAIHVGMDRSRAKAGPHFGEDTPWHEGVTATWQYMSPSDANAPGPTCPSA